MSYFHSITESQDATLPKRLVSLIISILIALASGTPYLYGAYSPQLVKQCSLTTSNSATISLSINLGSSIGGLIGGLLIDKFGPQLSILSGSICIFAGYFSMHKIYENKLNNLILICASMIIAGFGSITCYFATLKAAQSNFPKNRGTAGAFPVSSYGFAATIFSIISASFFNENAGDLLKFLALFCGSMTFVGSFFIHIYVNHDEDDEIMSPESIPTNYNSYHRGQGDDDAEEEELTLLPSELESQPPSTATFMERDPSLKGSFSFWGVGQKIPVSEESNEIETTIKNLRSQANTSSLPSSPTTTVASPWIAIKDRLTDKYFLTHYFIVSISSGIGQMYIYTVGFIVTAQFYYHQPPDDFQSHDPRAASLQALQVSIISVSSFLGRLVSGFLSDYLEKRFKIQRLTIVLITLIILNIGQTLIIMNISNNLLLSVSSSIMGSSYGLIFGTYPAIIADEFGIKTFSTNWGLVCTGPLFTLWILNKYFGWIYDSKINNGTGICYLGNECYKNAFELSFALCCLAFIVTLILIYIQKNRR